MRVTGGFARGRRFKAPSNEVRPSTDRLREALFSILQHKLPGSRVLDLFAGSGALGIEALSREAASATFVESSRVACRVIEENLVELGFCGTVTCREVLPFLRTAKSDYDLILADPPYAKWGREDHAAALLADGSLPRLLAPDGILVVEVEKERSDPPRAGWNFLDRRDYGSSSILLYERKV
jgi:16S rRNA (guanine(966)-N(2))-methyltransferase RsmD